jgi:RNA polymerase sigma-70 factor, ECF subfamily
MYKDHETPRFWITYSDALRKYLQKRLSDKSMIEDILHDVYLKVFVFCKRHEFSCEKAKVTNLRSWIFQVCHNTMVDRLKSDSKYKCPAEQLYELPENPTYPQENTFKADDLIKKLPPTYAEAVYLDTIIKMKQDCIAKKLGLGISATKSRIQRGKRLLRDIYLKQAQR